MAKLIIVDNKKENQDAYKVFETLVDFSVVQDDENKFEIRSNSNDGTITIKLSVDEFKKLLNEMNLLKRDCR